MITRGIMYLLEFALAGSVLLAGTATLLGVRRLKLYRGLRAAQADVLRHSTAQVLRISLISEWSCKNCGARLASQRIDAVT